jgi:chromosome partitioning protein
MSKTIVLATSKGGAGKSTLTRGLAAYWYSIGEKISIIDADPQGSIVNRHDFNGLLKNINVIFEPEETISTLVPELSNFNDKIIVDTGGFRNKKGTINIYVKMMHKDFGGNIPALQKKKLSDFAKNIT